MHTLHFESQSKALNVKLVPREINSTSYGFNLQSGDIDHKLL